MPHPAVRTAVEALMNDKKNTILIIDDDFINREVIKNIFDDNFVFIEAENGSVGLDLIAENEKRLSAIILDVNMPVMNGIEVLRRIKDRGTASVVPIFLVTSHEETDIAKVAYELGVMDVINKPINPFIIKRRVLSVVELFRARETLSARVRGQEEQLIENAHTIEVLHRGTVEALASAVEFRDVETGEHTNRIYGITKYILENTEMGDGFTAEEIESIAVGAIMHDIGKIAISDLILNKPGKLTREEFEIMKQHTVKGGELMKKISSVQKHMSYKYAEDIARHHHERWDGRGYPDGLRGDEITVWSQVVSIADVYDALVSPRVYRRAIDPPRAVEMIVGGECGCFNPRLIEAFLKVEGDIRGWYLADIEKAKRENELTETYKEKRKNIMNISEDVKATENGVTSFMLLMAAAQSAFDMIISVNLTANSFTMVNHQKFGAHRSLDRGVFDDLMNVALESVADEDKEAFKGAFFRESLLEAYASGRREINLQYKQHDDSGALRQLTTSVYMTEDSRSGQIIEITLSQYLDKDKLQKE